MLLETPAALKDESRQKREREALKKEEKPSKRQAGGERRSAFISLSLPAFNLSVSAAHSQPHARSLSVYIYFSPSQCNSPLLHSVAVVPLGNTVCL